MNVSSFSTSKWQPRERLEVWSEQIWSSIGRLNTVAATDAFEGSVTFGNAGVINICSIAVGPHRIERTPQLIRRDDRGVLKVVFQKKGSSLIEQCGSHLLMSPGDWTFYDTSRPYRVSTSEPVELLAVLIPRDKLMKANPDASRCALQRFSSAGGLGRIALNFVASLLEDLPDLHSQHGPSLSDTAIELVRLGMFERLRSHNIVAPTALLKERITTYINRHLRNPELSIDMIAGALRCSKRYLHKSFGADRDTLSHYLWNTRLDRSREDLTDAGLRAKSITLIAFSWGFSNAAHFSRAFKTRFGVTPSECRQAIGPSDRSANSRMSVEELPPGLAAGIRVARTY